MRCTGVKKGKKGGIRPCAENTIFALFPFPLQNSGKTLRSKQTLSLDTSPLKKRNTAELGYSWWDSSKIAVAFAKPVIENDI